MNTLMVRGFSQDLSQIRFHSERIEVWIESLAWVMPAPLLSSSAGRLLPTSVLMRLMFPLNVLEEYMKDEQGPAASASGQVLSANSLPVSKKRQDHNKDKIIESFCRETVKVHLHKNENLR